ncbi:hypothetical protein EsDP_00006691 [Epichloe bromicola]|uniref:Uncharacterized protein n=1 Tax=Epichloe bromicola TaxID=79588 RepID=A0ABQ0CYE2_9HYPO
MRKSFRERMHWFLKHFRSHRGKTTAEPECPSRSEANHVVEEDQLRGSHSPAAIAHTPPAPGQQPRRAGSNVDEGNLGTETETGHDTTTDAVRPMPPREPQQKHETVDYTTHERAPAVVETVKPRVHTVYEIKRTRSIHFHEHFFHVQPIVEKWESDIKAYD